MSDYVCLLHSKLGPLRCRCTPHMTHVLSRAYNCTFRNYALTKVSNRKSEVTVLQPRKSRQESEIEVALSARIHRVVVICTTRDDCLLVSMYVCFL